MHIPKKHPAMKCGKFKINMDNTKPHTAKIVRDYLEWLGIFTVPHPLYRPDQVSNDFFLYFKVKKVIKGQSFPNIEGLKSAVYTQLNRISKNGLENVFKSWELGWENAF